MDVVNPSRQIVSETVGEANQHTVIIGKKTTSPSVAENTETIDWCGKVLKRRYRIKSLLGSGGMSDVYLATDVHLEKTGIKECQVAIKILRSQLTQDFNSIRMLAREAAKSKRLAHPHIIRVYDLEYDNVWFMVMELLEGEPLSKVIQRAKPNGLKWPGAKALLLQVVDALSYSHSQGIVHADLKPSNIFVTTQGDIKLLDFGVSQALKSANIEDYLAPAQAQVDDTTHYGYTPAYASTAVIAGKEPTPKDDIYALACVSYELISSRHPFDRKKLDETERKAYPLRKPAHCPGAVWRSIRGVLKEQQSAVTLADFAKIIRPKSHAQRLYPLLLTAVSAGGLFGWYYNTHQQSLLEHQLHAYEQHQQYVNGLSQTPITQLSTSLDQLNEIERAGVLVLNQQRLNEYYEKQINEQLATTSDVDLPNYPAAIIAIEKALELYPTNERLQALRSQLYQQQESLYQSISIELEARLLQANFNADNEFEEMVLLHKELAFLGQPLLPLDPKAVVVYKAQLETALLQRNVASLNRLITIGEMFYSRDEQVSLLLTQSIEMGESIRALANYQSAIEKGEQAVFPMEAAEAFYAGQFNDWDARIASAKKRADLDSVYNDVLVFEKKYPVALEALTTSRKTLAEAYLSMSNWMLKKNYFNQARSMMQRANQLLSQ